MNLILLIGALVCAGLGLCLGILSRRLSSAGEVALAADWINELSIERYRPMVRLLDDRDLRHMRTQPGYTRQAEASLRAQRYHIFCGYLRCLERDFHSACRMLKLLMVQSREDRADLAAQLIRQRFAFACGTIAIQFRLALYRYAWGGVDASDLVHLFDLVRLELQAFAPVASPNAA